MARTRLKAIATLLMVVAVAGSGVLVAQGAEQKFVELNGEKFPALAALGPPPIPMDLPQKRDARGFPVLDDPLVQLGFLMMFEGRLTGDGSLSCATCHVPKEGWGLSSAISRGYPGTSHWKNSQTVVNTAYLGKLFWQGDSLALEAQGEAANTGLSGNAKTDLSEERLRQVPEYVKRFKEVFGTEWPILKDAWRAVAAFQRALNDENTPFDRYMRGDKSALTPKQVKGLELFQGKAGCIQCHNGPMLTDEKYYNTGLPQQEEFLKDPVLQFSARWQHYQRGVAEEIYRKSKTDLGLYFVTKVKDHMAAFRTAPLRHLVYTAPYMHNGVFDTLEDVVEFYNEGGGDDPIQRDFGFSTKTKRLKPLKLTKEEKEALVAFLESTTGKEIILPQPKIPDDGIFPAALAKFGKLPPEKFIEKEKKKE